VLSVTRIQGQRSLIFSERLFIVALREKTSCLITKDNGICHSVAVALRRWTFVPLISTGHFYGILVVGCGNRDGSDLDQYSISVPRIGTSEAKLYTHINTHAAMSITH
jgi:hypothetical protein